MDEKELRKELDIAINKIVDAHRLSTHRGYCNCNELVYFYMAGKGFISLLVGWNAVHNIETLKTSEEYEHYVIDTLSKKLNSVICPVCHGDYNED